MGEESESSDECAGRVAATAGAALASLTASEDEGGDCFDRYWCGRRFHPDAFHSNGDVSPFLLSIVSLVADATARSGSRSRSPRRDAAARGVGIQPVTSTTPTTAYNMYPPPEPAVWAFDDDDLQDCAAAAAAIPAATGGLAAQPQRH